MRLAAHMVVKDDEYYVDMALKSVAPNVEGIYVQDQSSTDGTADVVREVQNLFPDKIFLDTVEQPYERFHKDYNEVEYRNRAVEKTIEIYNPDFMCKLDADEIITQSFFDTMRNIGNLHEFNAVCVSESRFISRKLVSEDREVYGWKIDGRWYYGGHTLFWRVSLGVRYHHNPAFPGCHFHPLLLPDPRPSLWLPGNYHIHLHRTFGPKAFDFWREGGDEFENHHPFNPRVSAPKWFNDKVNLPTCVEIDYDWPDYVLEKWKAWGIWD